MRGYPARGRHVRWRVRSFEQGSIGVWARSLVRAVGNDEAMTCGPCVGRASSPFCVARIPEKRIEKRGREGLVGRARHSSLHVTSLVFAQERVLLCPTFMPHTHCVLRISR